jgi:hypothetical protein
MNGVCFSLPSVDAHLKLQIIVGLSQASLAPSTTLRTRERTNFTADFDDHRKALQLPGQGPFRFG